MWLLVSFSFTVLASVCVLYKCLSNFEPKRPLSIGIYHVPNCWVDKNNRRRTRLTEQGKALSQHRRENYRIVEKEQQHNTKGAFYIIKRMLEEKLQSNHMSIPENFGFVRTHTYFFLISIVALQEIDFNPYAKPSFLSLLN